MLPEFSVMGTNPAELPSAAVADPFDPALATVVLSQASASCENPIELGLGYT